MIVGQPLLQRCREQQLLVRVVGRAGRSSTGPCALCDPHHTRNGILMVFLGRTLRKAGGSIDEDRASWRAYNSDSV